VNIKALYLTPQEEFTGSLAVTTGLMQLLKGKFQKVAFFRPIIKDDISNDNDINFISDYFSIEMKSSDMYGMKISKERDLISNGKIHEMIEILIKKFKKLEKKYDFVFIKGVTKSQFTNSIDMDINLYIAKNLGVHFISVLNGYGKDIDTIEDEVNIEELSIKKEQCSHFATFVNRVDDSILEKLKINLNRMNKNYDIFVIPDIKKLDSPTVGQIKKELDCDVLFGDEEKLNITIGRNKISAMTIENLLERIEDKDLIIVPGDRSELIMGLLLSIHSKNGKKLSAILLTGDLTFTKNVKKVLDGLGNIAIPILSTKYDTYETANKVNKVRAIMESSSTSQIALALGNFFDSVESSKIVDRLSTKASTTMTPIMFEYRLFERAKQNKKTIILPEGNDDRILRASEILLLRDIVNIIILGDEEELRHKSNLLGIDISKATIINPLTYLHAEIFADVLYDLRKDKGLTKAIAHDLVYGDYNVFATMMVHFGYAHGMVSGAVGSTANTVRPALQIIKTQTGTSIVSSLFFMCLDTKVLVYADCALNQDPTAQELAQIAISSANTAKSFGLEPKIAMLSYSTGDSGSGEDVDKVKEATKLVKEIDSSLLVEGPIQYDAAVDKGVAKKKLPNSKVAGIANIFIFPDLNTGNNTYKAVQRSSNALAIGPVLQGLNKPINDLSRGCLVDDIVNTVAITAIQAQGE